jgi:hypothetical protein
MALSSSVQVQWPIWLLADALAVGGDATVDGVDGDEGRVHRRRVYRLRSGAQHQAGSVERLVITKPRGVLVYVVELPRASRAS